MLTVGPLQNTGKCNALDRKSQLVVEVGLVAHLDLALLLCLCVCLMSSVVCHMVLIC